jgi:hypothetical protein
MRNLNGKTGWLQNHRRMHFKGNCRLLLVFPYYMAKESVKKKVNCTGRTAHRRSRGIAPVFHDHDTRRGEGSASRPGRSLPSWKTRYPLYRRLGGPQGRSGQVRKISPPPGFEPRTVQPVVSRIYRLRYPANKGIQLYLKYVFVHNLRVFSFLKNIDAKRAKSLENR